MPHARRTAFECLQSPVDSAANLEVHVNFKRIDVHSVIACLHMHCGPLKSLARSIAYPDQYIDAPNSKCLIRIADTWLRSYQD